MTIRIVRLGQPRAAREGLRIGAVRRPPRGVPKSEWARRDYYDVWLPMLAPSEPLVKQALAARTAAQWNAFKRRYVAQMKQADSSRLLDFLAALSHESAFSLGCYCEEESRCHRSILRELLAARGAELAG